MDTNQSTTHALPQTGYIRRYRLADALGVHVATVDRWVKAKVMPQPIKLGEKITAFDAVEINNWLANRRRENI
ncbi:helix-turn-helix transcriptional regulator [Klebsiella pasteurii]|uniref:helix-turn-helix transcriptional regulator n=1 Tax=Klebsiella pasteurii TaxID=2587529 RepID=UPI002891FF55|nr:AlpA family phage regulatory protein [Klebsiella oxytoca]